MNPSPEIALRITAVVKEATAGPFFAGLSAIVGGVVDGIVESVGLRSSRINPQENSLSTPQKRPVFRSRHPKSKVFIANRAIKAPLSLGVLIAPPFPLGLCGPPGRRLGRPPPPRGGYRPISGRARPPAPPASTAPQPGPGIDSGALKPGKAGMLFKTPLLLGDPKRDPA